MIGESEERENLERPSDILGVEKFVYTHKAIYALKLFISAAKSRLLMMKNMKITLILGTRPQIIKSAPLIRLAELDPEIDLQIVHTGQHYDYEMSKEFFEELNLPDPVVDLNIGSGTHAWQTGKMMIGLEKLLVEEKPNMVVVPGDTNSTIAGALATAKLHMPVAHIESGARSYDMSIPEEINRRLTDHCSTVLFAPTKNCVNNLLKEGIDEKNIHLVGDTMYDSLLQHLPKAMEKKILDELNLEPKDYAVLTMHRPDHVDFPEILKKIIETMMQIRELVIVFPVHPRTMNRLKEAGLQKKISKKSNIRLIKPAKYHEMLMLMKEAKIVFTDSGGIQKEAFWLQTPCATLRDQTEWIETVDLGANALVGVDPKKILLETERILRKKDAKKMSKEKINPFGDGKASQKILRTIKDFCSRV